MAIIFYGAGWCSDCRRSKAYLDEKKISYEYINIDTAEGAAEEVVKLTGRQSIPTIVFPNGKILIEPSNKQLQEVLEENSMV